MPLGFTSGTRQGEDIALARRLFETLRDKILDGTWSHGDKLPGTRTLARDAGVSRWTVVVAVELLLAEGLVETRNRSGTYVSWGGHAAERRSQFHQPTQPHVPFAVGTPGLDLFPTDTWRTLQSTVWRRMPTEALTSGHAAGWRDLRVAIAARAEATRGIRCSAEQVIILPSAHAALHLVCEVLGRPGSVAWVEEPGYFRIRMAIEASGLSPVGVAVDDGGIDIADGLRLAPKAALAVVTPSFQFPTGVFLSKARKEKLLQWSADVGSFLVEDDYGCEFQPARPEPLAAMPNAHRVVYMNSFSLTVFPSLRLCYLIVPPATCDRFAHALRRTDRYAAIPNQVVTAEFMRQGYFATHLTGCQSAYAARSFALKAALRAVCPDVFAGEPAIAGLHLCARFRERLDDAAIAHAAAAAGIVVEPLSRFYAGDAKQSGLLLGFAGFPERLLASAATELARVIEASKRA